MFKSTFLLVFVLMTPILIRAETLEPFSLERSFSMNQESQDGKVAANETSQFNLELGDDQLDNNELRAYYTYDPITSHCTSILCKDEYRTVCRAFYFYGEDGVLKEAMIDDGQGDLAEDLTGATERRTIRFIMGDAPPIVGKPLSIQYYWREFPFSEGDEKFVYEVSFQYSQDGEIESSYDSRGGMALKSSDISEQNLSEFIPKTSNFHSLEEMPAFSEFSERLSGADVWNSITDVFFTIFHNFQLAAKHSRKNWNTELNFPDPVAKRMEKIGKTLFGKSTYVLMGHHYEETHVDSYRDKEISNKVRVTFINGILNTYKMLHDSLETISSTHGGVKIHYVFRPTEGWTWDVSRAILIKTAFNLGFRSMHAQLLAEMWKKLIQEMGGIQGGGVIIHYAHSLGGTETDRARHYLSPEEQKMIRIVTFGSATLVPTGGYQKVTNMASVNDGVSKIFEPFGLIRNYFDSQSNVCYYGSYFSWPCFPFDHSLSGRTYNTILQNLGDHFLKEFAS